MYLLNITSSKSRPSPYPDKVVSTRFKNGKFGFKGTFLSKQQTLQVKSKTISRNIFQAVQERVKINFKCRV